jgi:hypothetical protein
MDLTDEELIEEAIIEPWRRDEHAFNVDEHDELWLVGAPDSVFLVYQVCCSQKNNA